MDSKKELPHFYIDDSLGEQQKWYPWHWFILNGYEVSDEDFFVKAVSYGVGRWFNFATLWNTGNQRKGGLILFDEM